MTINEFNKEFARMERHFRIDQDHRADILKDWFKVLSHYHVDAVSSAIDEVIQYATETYWPAVGVITEKIRAKMSRYEQTRQNCSRCGGTTWIESIPWRSNGQLYVGFQRCGDCGVPPPNYTPSQYREPLTATEYAEHLAARTPRYEQNHETVDQMLAHLRAKLSMPPAKVYSREPGEEG